MNSITIPTSEVRRLCHVSRLDDLARFPHPSTGQRVQVIVVSVSSFVTTYKQARFQHQVTFNLPLLSAHISLFSAAPLGLSLLR